MKTFALIISMLFFVGFAQSAEVDVKDLVTWKPIASRPCANGGVPHMHVLAENPNKDGQPSVVEIVLNLQSQIMGYRYEDGDRVRTFNLTKEGYKEVLPKSSNPKTSI